MARHPEDNGVEGDRNQMRRAENFVHLHGAWQRPRPGRPLLTAAAERGTLRHPAISFLGAEGSPSLASLHEVFEQSTLAIHFCLHLVKQTWTYHQRGSHAATPGEHRLCLRGQATP